jgi:hypothetical protein
VLMLNGRCRLLSDSFCFLGTGGGRYDRNFIAISVHYVLERILYWVDVINQQSCHSAFQWSRNLVHFRDSFTHQGSSTTKQFEGR